MTATLDQRNARTGPLDPVGADLTKTLKALKLGQMTQTLPERLALARQRKMGHAAFLELILTDEVARRESRSAMLRARTAGLDPAMRLDAWDELDDLTYDRELLSDLTSLRFTEAGNGVLILGPVGVGKTHLASALGHTAIRRRLSVHASRADKLFTRLRAARLDNTPGRRDPQARPRRRAHPRRLRPQAAGHHRDQRLLRAHRRTAPQGIHDRDLEPGTRRVADHDERRPARPVRRRPAHRRRTHPRHRRALLPPTRPQPA